MTFVPCCGQEVGGPVEGLLELGAVGRVDVEEAAQRVHRQPVLVRAEGREKGLEPADCGVDRGRIGRGQFEREPPDLRGPIASR